MDKVLTAAQASPTPRRSQDALKALAPELAPKDEAAGYRVQRCLHDLLLPERGTLAGYKIGCTSRVMQEYLGIPHPCAGGVFEREIHETDVRLNASDFVRVGVECEIA